MKRRIQLIAVLALILTMTGALQAFAAARSVESGDIGGNLRFRDTTTGSTTQIVIQAGDQISVRVLDNGGSGQRHTVEISGITSSGPLAAGAVYNTPALSAGTYTMFCKPHRNLGHTITVIVEADATTTTTTTTTAPTTTTTTTTPDESTTTTIAETTTTTVAGAATTTTPDPISTTSTTPEASATTQDGTAGTPTTDSSSGEATNQTATAELEVTQAAATGDNASDGLLPVGTTSEGDKTGWLRSVWVGFFALIPLAGAAVVVGNRSEP